MYCFKQKTEILFFPYFSEFSRSADICKSDFILTNKYIFDEFLSGENLPCEIRFQENYGSGEPNSVMVDNLRKEVGPGIDRVIAIGGGTIIDLAKILVYEGVWKAEDFFMGRLTPHKKRTLIVIPTTCGTGSEMTNISICELKELNIKKGIAIDSMYAEKAVLIPELLKTLPYEYFANSSVDAFIHGIESYLSPKGNQYTRMYSEKAIEILISGFQYVKNVGKEHWLDKSEGFLIASNMAGTAFGNAGCAAVHATSYPLGGIYHIPHGEANHVLLGAVLLKYKEKKPTANMKKLEMILSNNLNVSESFALNSMLDLLEIIHHKKTLREYGIQAHELSVFADSVIENQQRLLNNNYVELSKSDILDIYQASY